MANAVQRLKMLPSTRRAKGILRDARATSIAERMRRPPLGSDTAHENTGYGMKSVSSISILYLVQLSIS